MSILDKKYLLTINLDKNCVESPQNMSFFNTDKNIANLYVKVKYTDGIIQHLSKEDAANYLIKLTVIKPNTKTLREIVGVITSDFEEDYAIYKFELPSVFTDQVGLVACEFLVVNSIKELTIDSFSYTIKPSKVTGLNAEIIVNPDYPILKQLIEDVRNAQKSSVSIDDTTPSDIKTYSSKKIDEFKNNSDTKIDNIATIIDFERKNNENWDVTVNRAISEGKTIKFLNHIYQFYNTINLKNNTTFILDENTTLKREHENYMFLGQFDKTTTSYDGVQNISFSGGTIDHNYTQTPKNLCMLFHANNIRVENVTFKDIVGSHALDLVGCKNVYINKCNFLGYNHATSTVKYREVIQIDVAGSTGAGLDATLYPTDSPCFDGTRCKNITISNCVFDKSENCPPPHNCIGTHSQVAIAKTGDKRSNHITIFNNKFIGNGVITTVSDDGAIAMAGKCIRLIQFDNVKIEGNSFENYGRCISIETFKSYRALTGELINEEALTTQQDIGNTNIFIANNKIDASYTNDIGDYYTWNGISISSSITSCRHKNIIIQGNNIENHDSIATKSVGVRCADNCLITNNNFLGGDKAIYVEAEFSSNVNSNSNNYTSVNIPVDFVGAFSNNCGEHIPICEDGTANKYIIYINNSTGTSSTNPQLRVKCSNTGANADIVTNKSMEWLDVAYESGITAYSSSVTCKYSKDPFSMVHLEGACTHAANSANLTLFTLPEGYRPTMALAFITVAAGSSGRATNRIKVNTNGTVVLETTDSTSSTPYTNVNGIMFRV